MFKSFIRSYGLFLIALLFLSACTMPLSSGSTPSSQDIIYTAAAQTVEAQLTQAGVNLDATTTPQPEAPTATLAPAQPTATSTQEPPQATATTRPTAKPATATSVPTPCDRAQFVKDVTYADGTEVTTGSDFTKTWRLKNTGTCTWDSGYSLVFKGRSKMSGPSDQQLTDGTVDPGETVDVSVDLTAPSTPGSYEGDWMLQNDSGNNFGIGNDAKSFFWVKITAVEGTRVSMDTGATTAYVTGHLAKNDSATYLVGAKANQYMMVTINTDDQSLYLQIEAPDGTILLDSSDESNTWQGKLPDDGDYKVTIVNDGAGTDFNFSVTIPVRVTFKKGATSATMDGTVGPNDINTYLLKALKDQTMTVSVDSPKNNIYLTIYGLADGELYVRSALKKTSFSFDLPSTQDYVIELVSTNNKSEDYTVKFIVK